MMSRSLLCASNGENSASDEAPSIVRNGGSCEIMLFGVRVKVDPMRKSVSMNNLSEYEQPQELANYAAADISASASAIVATGYASADDAAHHQSAVSRERKRGVPWTEEEHKLFLLGLQTVGKGDWRGIARNFVKTRTSTQVASHAQKYFLRRSNLNRRRRRSSLFDITTDSVTAIPMEEEFIQQDNLIRPVMQQQEHPNLGEIPTAPYPMQINNPLETLALGNADQLNNAPKALIHPLSFFPIPNPPPPVSIELNSGQELTIENSPLSLNLSLSSNHQHQMSLRHSTCQAMPSFSNGNGDSVISVA